MLLENIKERFPKLIPLTILTLKVQSMECFKGNPNYDFHGYKSEGRFRLDTKKKFLTERIVRHDAMPRESVDVPCLEMFKARVNGALSNLVWWKIFLSMGKLELDGH